MAAPSIGKDDDSVEIVSQCAVVKGVQLSANEVGFALGGAIGGWLVGWLVG